MSFFVIMPVFFKKTVVQKLPKNHKANSLMRFIWRSIQPYRGRCFCLFVVALLWGIEMSIRPYMFKLLLDRLETTPLEQGSIAMALLLPSLGYLGCEAGINLIFRFYDYVRMFVYPSLQANIMREATTHIQGHSHNFFLERFSGNIASQIKELATGVKEILQIANNRFCSHIFGFIVACATIVFVNSLLAVIVIMWTVFFIFITLYLSKKTAQVSKKAANARNQTIGKITDSIFNIMTVRLFSRRGYEISRIEQQLSEQIICDKNLEWTNLKIRTIQGSSILVMMALLLATLIHARSQELVTIGDFGLILTIGISISTAIQNLSQDLLTFSELIGKCSVSLQLMNAPHEITDSPEAQPLSVTKGEIIFDHLTFNYGNGCPLFQDLSLVIRGGEKIGLVGFSGAGKSSFIHLLVRFFDPQSGTISIDGQKIREVTQESLRDRIALIPQDPPLFHRTIGENILYGRPQATEAELLEACHQAHALEFIRALPQGFDTMVGERGLRLSGGQKQRVAIARAFLKNPPILVLDEATSSLDFVSEREVQKSLYQLMQNKTVLVIAHRLFTLRSMDRLLFFQQGKIIEDGTHSELLDRQSHYAHLWNIHLETTLQR